MPSFPAILSLIVAIAGWFYLFFSKAAVRLNGLEPAAINSRRSRYRRLNGFALLLLATGFYAGFQCDPHLRPGLFLCIWISVFVLLILVLLLAVADLRFTARIRRKN